MSTSTYSQESQRLLSPLLSPEEPSSEQTMSRFVPGLKTKTRLIFHTVRSLNIGVFITAPVDNNDQTANWEFKYFELRI